MVLSTALIFAFIIRLFASSSSFSAVTLTSSSTRRKW
uniref:Uncharacterized protein n=1 Tax=Anguilla anguilla TaxID=7936 RepID=A0A0E9R2R3_ANGAN